jgi:hypothetical protein
MENYEEPDGLVEEINQEVDEGTVDEAIVPRDDELPETEEPLADPRLESGRLPQAGL